MNHPKSTENYYYPDTPSLSERVSQGIRRNIEAIPEIFPHRAVSVTQSYQDTEGLPLITRRAKMVEILLRNHPVFIQEGELIVGMKTPKPHGSPVYPEINLMIYFL